MPTSSRGELLFDETGESVGPDTTPENFTSLRIASRGVLNFGSGGPMGSTWKSDLRSIGGRIWTVTLEFDGPRLSGAELFLHMPTDGRDWSSWTHESEMARKVEGEAWAVRTFGAPLLPKPIDVNGKPITPLVTPELATHALHPWGEVASYYDSKGGMAFLRIVYSPRA